MMLSEELPDMYGRLRSLEITSDHFLLDWFMTLFCRKLPLRTVARIWDLYLIGGEIELHKAAISIVRYHRGQLVNADSMEAGVKVLTGPLDELNEDDFVASVCKVNIKDHWVSVLAKIGTWE